MAAGVCLLVGARPNFMKTASVVRAVRQPAPSLELILVRAGRQSDLSLQAADEIAAFLAGESASTAAA